MQKPEILEFFTLSKKGDQERNEDALYVGDCFIAVADGVTPKAPQPEGATETSGRFASRTLCSLLPKMPALTQPEEMLTWLNTQLKQKIAESVFADCPEKPSASVIFYDALTQRVISYGDCQLLLGGQVYKREKAVDKRLSEKRSQILQERLEQGCTPEELLQNDVGRAAIVAELMTHAAQNANKPGGEGFPVLGIGEIVPEYIDIYPVSGEVVLASDGYPELADTLQQSEMHLQEVVQTDPLLICKYKSTKGMAQGNVSYDDRTYIRFAILTAR